MNRKIDLAKNMGIVTTSGSTGSNISVGIGDYDGGYSTNIYYDPKIEMRKVFYEEMMEYIDVPSEKKESIRRMLSSSDQETFTMLKEIMSSLIKEHLGK